MATDENQIYQYFFSEEKGADIEGQADPFFFLTTDFITNELEMRFIKWNRLDYI